MVAYCLPVRQPTSINGYTSKECTTGKYGSSIDIRVRSALKVVSRKVLMPIVNLLFATCRFERHRTDT